MVQRHYHLEKSNFTSLCPWIVKVTFLSSSVSMIPSSPSAPFCPPLFLLSLFFFACVYFWLARYKLRLSCSVLTCLSSRLGNVLMTLLNSSIFERLWSTWDFSHMPIVTIGYLILTEFIKHVFPRFFSPSLFLGLALFSSFDCWTELIQAKFRSSG